MQEVDRQKKISVFHPSSLLIPATATAEESTEEVCIVESIPTFV